jgi:hypothetical protein
VTAGDGGKFNQRNKMFTLVSSLSKSFNYCRENVLSKSMKINLYHKVVRN